MRWLRWCGITSALLLVLTAAALGGMLWLGTARSPAVSPSFGNQFRRVDYSDLPSLEYYQARDGIELAYRRYSGNAGPATTPQRQPIAVLIHGASDSSAGMHVVAKALAQAGVTSYVPDVRGHGANHPHGDIRYSGQLDHDLVDFVRQQRPKHPRAQWTLIGFSAGGGFALRVDGGSDGEMFDRYVLLAPGLRYDAPTARALPRDGGADGAQRFVAPYIGRLIAITALNAVGIHWFDRLTVLAFAVPPNSLRFTPCYSMRLLENFSPRHDYLADIRNIHRPTVVLVGTRDEFSLADQFAPVFHSQRQDVAVTVLPGLTHLDLITSPEAVRAITAAVDEAM